ncbi:hypothetical protein GJ496_006025 [Pomphorhynchus laevis]|nr:hypothetical protein GJ496_006025 [Pomphorhynchus laevis]
MESTVKRTFIERGFRDVMDTDRLPHTGKNQSLRTLIARREDEKKELGELNDKFATYLSRVQYLGNLNRNLEIELEDLRNKWGLESSRIREHYDNDLAGLRRHIDDATKDKALMELRLKRAVYDSDMIKHQIDFNSETVNIDRQKLNSLMQMKETLSSERDMLENKFRDALEDITKYRTELNRLLQQLDSVKNDLDAHSLGRVQLQNDLQTLEDQLTFVKAIHEEELSELRTLNTPNIDTGKFYRAELTEAISDIRRDFGKLSREQQSQLEEYYKVKTEEIQEQANEEERKLNAYRISQDSSRSIDGDINNMRHNLARSREELIALQRERIDLENQLKELEEHFEQFRLESMRVDSEREITLQNLRNNISEQEQALSSAVEGNVSLRFEINTYKRLLECEESRLTRDSREDWRSSAKAERISVHKKARSPVSIEDIDPSGSCITLVNTSTNRNVDLKGWYLRRKIDQQPEMVYYIPNNITMKALSTLRIYSNSNGVSLKMLRNSPDLNEQAILAENIQSWSLGNSTETKLLGDDGQEKAVYYQRIGG